MNRENSKTALRIITAKIISPFSSIKTPNGRAQGLSERMMNLVSPQTNNKAANTERKVVTIDLKLERKNNLGGTQSKDKRVVKIRRKTETTSNSTEKKSVMNVSMSEKIIKPCQSSKVKHPNLKCFDEVNTIEFGEENKSMKGKQSNWDQIIESKKQQLYSQLYKMDKRIFSIERDLQQVAEMPGKKNIIEMIKKKTSKPINMNETTSTPFQIHKNIYKMGKNRVA